MTFSRSLPFVLFWLGSACGAGTPPRGDARAPGTTTLPRSHPLAAGRSTQVSAPLTSARVVVTGVLTRSARGVEICPGDTTAPCAGIELLGKVEPAWLSRPGQVSVWQVHGSYDGDALLLEAPAQPTLLGRPPDYRNPCAEYQQELGAARRERNPDARLLAAVEALAGQYPERIAGRWWDATRETMVVWVTGDATALEQETKSAPPKVRLCVTGQARFSERELEEARTVADRILEEQGIVWSSSSIDVLDNRVEYEVEAIDPQTLGRVAAEAGAGVHVRAFIRSLDRRVSELPVPRARGDVALLTAKSRSGASMQALGQFTLHYDAAAHCIHLQDAEGGRVLPVWPFGYWATSQPLRVFDYDGNLVARPGAPIEFSGGGVDVQHLGPAGGPQRGCGAKSAWIGRPVRALAAE